MLTTIYQETGMGLDIDCIVENVPRLAPDLKCVRGTVPFKIKGSLVSTPETYRRLPRSIVQECKDSDSVLLFTEKRYDNNYFQDGVGKRGIISLHGWEQLTTLPRNNGAVYFLCCNLIEDLAIGVLHDEDTGCMNDFLWNKSAVHMGMLAARICQPCLDHFRKHGDKRRARLLPQVQAVLNDLGAASRKNVDICEYWRQETRKDVFDVFLCHNSRDKKTIRRINAKLKANGIRTWLDEEQSRPGVRWQKLLQKQISRIKTAAIFVGPRGLGPWQDVEVEAILKRFAQKHCRVIPVILRDATRSPKPPAFLDAVTYVDFRKKTPDPFKQLLWGITGKPS